MTRLVIAIQVERLLRVMLDVHEEQLGEDAERKLVRTLHAMAYAGRTFNTNLALRSTLWKRGFFTPPAPVQGLAKDQWDALIKLPHLLEQEVFGYRHLLSVLFRLYTGHAADDTAVQLGTATNARTADLEGENRAWMVRAHSTVTVTNWRADIANQSMRPVCEQVLQRYVFAEQRLVRLQSADEEVLWLQQEVSSLVPIVAHVLRGILRFDDVQFAGHVPWLFAFLTDLVMSEDRLVRSLVRDLLQRKVVGYIPREASNPPTGGASGE